MVVAIVPGMRVIAHSTFDGDLPRRAISGVVDGKDFPVVWVCKEGEWEEAREQGREPQGWPWPAEDVRRNEPTEDRA